MQLRNKVLKIVLSCLAVIPLLLPFQMSAETVSGAPIIGVNITLIDYDYSYSPYQGEITLTTDQTRWHCESWSSGCRTWVSEGTDDVVDNEITGTISYTQTIARSYLYEYDFIFDKAYVGSIRFSDGSLGATSTKTYYVNGTHLKLTSTTLIDSFTISSYNLNALPENVHQWIFPIESFSFISSFLYYNQSYLKEYYQLNSEYIFPVFNIPSGATIYNLSSGVDKFRCIMFIGNSQAYSLANVKNILIDFGSLNVDNFQYWSNTRMWQNGATGYFVSFDITISSYTTYVIKSKAGFPVIPIYFDSLNKPHVSTEFALQFGLSNELLDNIEIIANGTASSNTSSNSLESQNTQFSTDSSNLMNLEDTLGNQMNNNLQQIDTNFDVGNQFGSKFLASAEWVRNQYNTLTSNTPFGTFISFSLLIGLALLLMGRLL